MPETPSGALALRPWSIAQLRCWGCRSPGVWISIWIKTAVLIQIKTPGLRHQRRGWVPVRYSTRLCGAVKILSSIIPRASPCRLAIYIDWPVPHLAPRDLQSAHSALGMAARARFMFRFHLYSKYLFKSPGFPAGAGRGAGVYCIPCSKGQGSRQQRHC